MTKSLPDWALLLGELTGLASSCQSCAAVDNWACGNCPSRRCPARYFLGRILLTSQTGRTRSPFIFFFFFLGFCPLVAFGVTSLPVAEPNGGGKREGGSRREWRVGDRRGEEERKDGRGGGAELGCRLRVGCVNSQHWRQKGRLGRDSQEKKLVEKFVEI